MKLPFVIDKHFPISDNVRLDALNDVLMIIERGAWFKPNESTHGLTTKSVLFERTDEHWLIIKESFINAIFQEYSLDRNKKFEAIAWCYVNEPNKPSILNWHVHADERNSFNTKRFTALMYLSIPLGADNYLCSTTEFLFDNGATISSPPVLNRWVIFDCLQYHRPGVWMFDRMSEYRVTLAADLILYE